MALGKNYEMAHQSVEHLINTEQYAARERAAERIGVTAMYLASVTTEFNTARDAGNIEPGLWKAMTDASVDHVRAFTELMNVNRDIHLGEQNGEL